MNEVIETKFQDEMVKGNQRFSIGIFSCAYVFIHLLSNIYQRTDEKINKNGLKAAVRVVKIPSTI